MSVILFFFIAFIATTAGSATGMGGGLLIKPALDAAGQMDALSVNLLSSVTVLSMSLISVIKYLTKTQIDLKTALPLAIGSVAGGWLGGNMISRLIGSIGNTAIVIQNIILIIVILCILLYMHHKDGIRTKNLSGIPLSAASGLGLGGFAAFLGIGGGPFNVALIIYLFSYSTKQAAVSSIVIILFSSIAKVSELLLARGFSGYDLTMLPPMIAGAVAGGFSGAWLQIRLSEKQVESLFRIIQIIVIPICLINIVRYWSL